MRMREMYTLTWSQVDQALKTVFWDKTKNGKQAAGSPVFRGHGGACGLQACSSTA